jgi:signal transduction histidine kinase
MLKAACPVENLPSQFSAALVHEIRNPLTNINLALVMLKAELPQGQASEYLDIIERSATRIGILTTELLTYHNILEVRASKHSITNLLSEVLDMAQDRIKLNNITVVRNFGKRDCSIILDDAKLKIGMTNIIINALDSMNTGDGELTVSTRFLKDKFLISIRDNGCGISPVNLKNIFKPFYTNKINGLGVGLSETLAILQSNHVGFSVESTVNQGTMFTLIFDSCHA